MGNMTNRASWIFGADPASDVWLNDSVVSAEHCRLSKTESGFELQDLGSSNGTFVNGRKIQHASVTPNDEIRLANQIRLPWPDESLAKWVIRIGAGEDNGVQMQHDSVSKNHAKLIVDQNNHYLICDLGSTNGTWVDERSIRAAVLRPDTVFRVGAVKTTAQQIVNQSRESTTRKRLVVGAAAVFAAMLTGLALVGILMIAWTKEASTDVVADNGKAVSDVLVEASTRVKTEGREADVARRGAGPSRTTSTDRAPADVVNAPDDIADESSGSEQTRPKVSSPTSVTKPLDPDQRVERALFILVVTIDQTKYDFATAWAIAPKRLVTNAHVVESVRRHGYQVSAVHLASGQECNVSSMGAHPSYESNREKFVTLTKRIDEQLEQLKQSNSDGQLDFKASGELEENIKKMKRDLPWIAQAADAFDAGWIDIEQTVASAATLQLTKAPVLKRRQLRMAGASIELDSAFYDPDIARSVSFNRLQAAHPVTQADQTLPFRWVCSFREDSDEWQYFLHDGCPILDVRGQVAGMYRGREQKLENLGSPQDSTLSVSVNIEMVPLVAINAVAGGASIAEVKP